LLQSFDFMLNSLVPGTNLKTFEIFDVITTSKTLKNMLDDFYGVGFYNTYVYNIGIPDYFEKPTKPKKPIISILGRNSNELNKVAKLFYSKNPQFNWVTFDPMLTKKKPPQQMARKDFANRLRENVAAVWVDRIASFGTFPLECMKSGTIPIGLKPDITPEYLLTIDEHGEFGDVAENIGFWSNHFYDLPDMISEVITKYLDDSIPDEIYDGMYDIASRYNQENSKNQLIEIYTKIIEERIELFEEATKKLDKVEKTDENE
jgi:hypothetical protein